MLCTFGPAGGTFGVAAFSTGRDDIDATDPLCVGDAGGGATTLSAGRPGAAETASIRAGMAVGNATTALSRGRPPRVDSVTPIEAPLSGRTSVERVPALCGGGAVAPGAVSGGREVFDRDATVCAGCTRARGGAGGWGGSTIVGSGRGFATLMGCVPTRTGPVLTGIGGLITAAAPRPMTYLSSMLGSGIRRDCWMAWTPSAFEASKSFLK